MCRSLVCTFVQSGFSSTDEDLFRLDGLNLAEQWVNYGGNNSTLALNKGELVRNAF